MHRRALMAAAVGSALARQASAAPAPGTPVVLELFTSQGCSSCPPADLLLGQLARRAGVIALAWHVDYWNNLGWRDPYATREATERQRAYARRLGEDVYTPALVLNGGRIVVGSDRSDVDKALTAAAPLPVAISLTRSAIGVTAAIADGRRRLSALLAIYDPELVTAVGAGENSGAHLREYRVVRETRLLAEWDGEARTISLPAIHPGQGAVALLQAADMRIVGAAELPPG